MGEPPPGCCSVRRRAELSRGGRLAEFAPTPSGADDGASSAAPEEPGALPLLKIFPLNLAEDFR
ncbi:MAG: hypothetical protein M3Y82_07255 [Verrucomicrobiota bacterium]|nr:hypothetical protein [Verrucomicrobiota bacterium]